MIKITIKEIQPTPRGMKRELGRCLKAMWADMGVMWHREFRPKHFTAAGAREYGYQPRSGERGSRGSKAFKSSYTGRKLRQKGHTLPLVWSGLSRTFTRMRDVRSTSKGARVVMNPPALNLRPKGGTIDMRDELTRISIRERHGLTARGNVMLPRQLNAIRGVSQRRLS